MRDPLPPSDDVTRQNRRCSGALGRRGEKAALKYLRRKKFKIVKQGFRLHRREIDIIAFDGATLVFIEVKTRRSNPFAFPEDAVSLGKQQRIRRVAQGFLALNGFSSDVECRFDVMALIPREGGGFRVRHIKNAFE